jgi:AcrR family transcriptional regulator
MHTESVALGSRADQILLGAREIFLAEGWDNFSIERIAEYVDCSRPLVYKYYPSKEEIMLALAIQSKGRRVKLKRLAHTFQGLSRERMLAIGEVENILMGRDLPVELFVASTNIRAKTSEARQAEMRALDKESAGLNSAIVREAIQAGDLTLPEAMAPEEMTFAMWATLWGAANIVRSDMPIEEMGILHPRSAIRYTLGAMLDGVGWKPLMSEHDYRATRKRVYQEVFTDEVVHEILTSVE